MCLCVCVHACVRACVRARALEREASSIVSDLETGGPLAGVLKPSREINREIWAFAGIAPIDEIPGRAPFGLSIQPMRMSFAHKREHSFEQRIAESARVRERYNDRVPVICEKTPTSDLPCENKCPMPAPPTLPHARKYRHLLPPRITPRQVEVPHPDGHDGLRRAVALALAPPPAPPPGPSSNPEPGDPTPPPGQV